MFYTHLLNPIQKSIIRSLAIEMATADDDVTFTESEYVQNLLTSLASDVKVAENALSLVKENFVSKFDKFAIIAHLCTIAALDNHNHDAEVQLISKVVEILELDANWFEQVNQWSKQAANMYVSALEIMDIKE